MKKRVMARIGNIFCAEIDNQYKVYFQYVAKDWEQLNSAVIRVFKKHYAIDYVPNFDEIVKGEVQFYAHVLLNDGIHEGVWYKAGTHKDLGDTENIGFRLCSEGSYAHMTKSYRWYVWKINQPHIRIGEMMKEYEHYDMGWVFPYREIISKIKTGKFIIKILD